MKRVTGWLVGLGLALLLIVPVALKALTAQEVYHKVKDSIFTLYSLDFKTREVKARGTAVAISKTILVTNCHLALSGNYLLVQMHENEKPRVARLYYKNRKQDLCLLEIPSADFSPVKMRSSASVEIGEGVYAIGNPKGTEKSISKGIVSNKHLVQGGIWLQTDAVIYFGSSGGGLFDENGNLVGVTTKMGGNFGFALPTEWIMQVMAAPQPKLAAVGDPKDPKDPKEKIGEHKIDPKAIKGLSELGIYGQDKIVLFRNNRECFLLIHGRDTNGNVSSLVLWNPKFENTIVAFPTASNAKEAMDIIYGALVEKRTENQSNYQSQSSVYIADQPYPLYGTKTIEKKYPFLVGQFSQTLRPTMLNSRAFRIIFKDDDPQIGNATIVYQLNGVAQALSAYNNKCQ